MDVPAITRNLFVTVLAIVALLVSPATPASAQLSSSMAGPARSFLARPGKVVPCGAIVTREGSLCPAGWVLNKDGAMYVATAAHCGQVGTEFGVVDADGYFQSFGHMVQRNHDPVRGTDRALIRVDRPHMVEPQIPVSNAAIAAPLTLREVATNRPTLCVLGQTSGHSCGPYHSIDGHNRINCEAATTHGDSGGSVFAPTDGRLHPVGILQGGFVGSSILVAQPPDTPIFQGAAVVH